MSLENKIKVSVAQGVVVGQSQPLPDGRQQYVFKGIPYAKPPIGELRFKSPIALDRFSEPILDCTEERDVCFQKDMMTGEFIGSENCLHLNVFTPINVNDAAQRSKAVPVMVWIHGGAFMSGSGNSDMYSPDYLVANDVIVVTLNYRLGAFGFLCLPEAAIPGNAGLKDQLLALKWIRQNISNFGGDPNNITCFGESAGAASIHLHALSKNSKHYFHKAILQSGTVTMDWVLQRNAVEKSIILAKLLGCTDVSSQKKVLDFLQTTDIPLQGFHEQMIMTLDSDERRRGLPIIFKPCIEAESPDAIVTEPPIDVLSKKNSIDMPMIMGNNSEEGIIMLLDSYKKMDVYDKDLARMIPKSLNLAPTDPECKGIANELRQIYFGGNVLDKEVLNDFVNLHSDYHFGVGLHISAELYARNQSRAPVYLYDFQHDGKLNQFKKAVGMRLQLDNLKGVSHGDDIFYLFRQTLLNDAGKPILGKSLSTSIANGMCKLWTNFAKYGNPTPSGAIVESDKCDFKWQKSKAIASNTENFEFDYLKIGDRFEMKSNPAVLRILFWRNLYEKWNGGFLKPKL